MADKQKPKTDVKKLTSLNEGRTMSKLVQVKTIKPPKSK